MVWSGSGMNLLATGQPIQLPASRRFAYKVYQRGDCWEWRGHRDPNGYGRFTVRTGLVVGAHVFAYETAKGRIPTGLCIDHLCRHPWCVRPSHLEVVTQTENKRRGDHKNSKKTHCPQGHPYTHVQQLRTRGPQRVCRICEREHLHAWRAAHRKPRKGDT